MSDDKNLKLWKELYDDNIKQWAYRYSIGNLDYMIDYMIDDVTRKALENNIYELLKSFGECLAMKIQAGLPIKAITETEEND